ncbi:DUF1801 domain-containing protein [Flavobacterium sediminilitoris]|uniref:DUF1801 domain-containing protein n=1 Tax=Flavobacterium sediminilitoris TaxID=2024526 RepID=A0ABY4HMR8_9FLAO|nr:MULTISPECIES: DUF1801 domain-containing protein [Flavobacterium]UOX34137.1 DUF1801 domain-containing protein [Flavobacterium sediminilitoris]
MTDKKIWDKANQWNEELELLKSIINTTNLIETTKWGTSVYTHNNKNIIGIGGFKSYFGLWFFNGVFLKDEYNLLINAQEGTTKSLRQMRFQSKADINEKIILEYLTEAIKVEENGLSIKPQKKEQLVSAFLQNEFKSDLNLKIAFEKLSPYKQREFIEYIETAKQEKTKLSRFEKIKPMILANIGLNDKYR